MAGRHNPPDHRGPEAVAGLRARRRRHRDPEGHGHDPLDPFGETLPAEHALGAEADRRRSDGDRCLAMDSALRAAMLRSLGLDLDIAANCEHDVAVDLISGCDWWRRFKTAWIRG